MSLSTIEIIMNRISTATIDSPIAVMKNNLKPDHLDAFYAGTVTAKWHIEANKDSFIGAFDGTMNPRNVRNKLINALSH